MERAEKPTEIPSQGLAAQPALTRLEGWATACPQATHRAPSLQLQTHPQDTQQGRKTYECREPRWPLPSPPPSAELSSMCLGVSFAEHLSSQAQRHERGCHRGAQLQDGFDVHVHGTHLQPGQRG